MNLAISRRGVEKRAHGAPGGRKLRGTQEWVGEINQVQSEGAGGLGKELDTSLRAC